MINKSISQFHAHLAVLLKPEHLFDLYFLTYLLRWPLDYYIHVDYRGDNVFTSANFFS